MFKWAISITVIFFWAIPQLARAAETDPAKLLSSLNSKTKAIKFERLYEDTAKGVTTVEKEVNSYTFSLEQKLLKIEYSEDVKTFKNDKYTERYLVTGKVSIDTNQLDREKILVRTTKTNYGTLYFYCKEQKKCVTGDIKTTEYYAKGDKTTERPRKVKTFTFKIDGAGKTLTDQISTSLKNLFAVLPSPPKPIKKPGIVNVDKK